MRIFKKVSKSQVGLALVFILALAAVFFTPNTYGAYTRTITNSTNTVSSVPGFTCLQQVQGATAYLAYPLTEANRTNGIDDVTVNNRNGVYTTGGITYGQPGPCPRDIASDSLRSILLNGTSGFAYGPNTTVNPTTLSFQIWFRTNTTTGGKLIGLGDSRTGTSGSYDRHLYLANNGLVVWGVYPGAVRTVNSTESYNDNEWHQAVGTLAPATSANPGLRLYVDGELVASDPTVVTAQNFAGFVRIGFDNLSGWGPTQPTSNYFRGNLAWASFYTFALTPEQIQNMYSAGRLL